MKAGPRHVVHETEDGTFEMTIKSAVRSDSGLYICKIINEYGTKHCEGKLLVQGKHLFKCASAQMYTSTSYPLSVDNMSVFCYFSQFGNLNKVLMLLDYIN